MATVIIIQRKLFLQRRIFTRELTLMSAHIAVRLHEPNYNNNNILILILDNFCIALFSGAPKLTALKNSLYTIYNRPKYTVMYTQGKRTI